MAGADPEVVTVSFNELQLGGADTLALLEDAFGFNGLGILLVSGVPSLAERRQQLLPLSQQFADLPADVRTQHEDPESSYMFGWSHGREMLSNGQRDVYKGSYYGNPVLDTPCTDAALMHQFPAYCRPNVWPHQHLPQLREAFRSVGKLIIDVGLLVAEQCDRYLQQQNPAWPPGTLQRSIADSACAKVGLLCCQDPAAASPPGPAAEDLPADSWCGEHTDHGALTGLTAAMYQRGPDEVPCPDSQAGLYIRTCRRQLFRVSIPPDHLAFQMGETFQVLTGGVLRATPHVVQAPARGKAAGIARSTFAVFMQPRWGRCVKCAACSAPLS
eukprot:jgi/Astpho2/6053/e_gw1.00084.69.1_t